MSKEVIPQKVCTGIVVSRREECIFINHSTDSSLAGSIVAEQESIHALIAALYKLSEQPQEDATELVEKLVQELKWNDISDARGIMEELLKDFIVIRKPQ